MMSLLFFWAFPTVSDADERVATLSDIQPVPRFGVCTHMYRRSQGWKVEKLIPLMKKMGVSVIRDGIIWRRTETVKGQYELTPETQQWIKAVTDANIKVILMLGYGNRLYDNALDVDAYLNFVTWIAEQFKDNPNIIAYEIWNEPNNFQFRKQYDGQWQGKDNAPWITPFSELVQKASAAIKKVDPDKKVISGAGNPPASQYMMIRHPEAFAQLDGLTSHPYTFRLPPEVVPFGGKDLDERDGIASTNSDHTLVSMWEIFKGSMQKNLGKTMPIWVTEVGYTTFNHTAKPSLSAGFTEAAQAAYLVRGLIANLAHPDVKVWCIYDLMNDGVDPMHGESQFGIVKHERENLAPKKAFFALRRTAELLGADSLAMQKPLAELIDHSKELSQGGLWQKRPVDGFVTDNKPYAFWFKTATGYVTFLWKGGRINTEFNPPLVAFPALALPTDTQVVITDLVSGQKLDATVQRAGNKVTVSNVPLLGHPVAIHWQTVSTIAHVQVPQTSEKEKGVSLTDDGGAWKFSNGAEFKGATGSISKPAGKDQPMILNFDFTKGGAYVAAIKPLEPKLNVTQLSLDIQGQNKKITVRIFDKTGQVFQYRLNGMPAVIKLGQTKPHAVFAGAKDKKFHQPIRAIWVMAGNSRNGIKQGQIQIKSIKTQ